MTSQEANKTMTASGYTTKQTRTAREKLKVVVTREGFGERLEVFLGATGAPVLLTQFRPF